MTSSMHLLWRVGIAKKHYFILNATPTILKAFTVNFLHNIPEYNVHAIRDKNQNFCIFLALKIKK